MEQTRKLLADAFDKDPIKQQYCIFYVDHLLASGRISKDEITLSEWSESGCDIRFPCCVAAARARTKRQRIGSPPHVYYEHQSSHGLRATISHHT
jgi:hypothetical protein